MTSDIERPRQRTVAELLAEYGDADSSSRRRRRRSPDDEPVDPALAAPPRPAGPGAGRDVPVVPDARLHAGRGEDRRRETYRALTGPSRPGSAGLPPRGAGPGREYPTDVMPRIPDTPAGLLRQRGPVPDLTGPLPSIGRQRAESGEHRVPGSPARLAPSRPAMVPDGGPPTQFSPGLLDDEDDSPVAGGERGDAAPTALAPNALAPKDALSAPPAVDAEADSDEWDEWSDEDWDDEAVGDEYTDGEAADRAADRNASGGRASGSEYADGEYADDEYDGEEFDDLDGAYAAQAGERTAGSAVVAEQDESVDESSAGPTWPAVIAQWIAGAVGGAALWVLFRYLWQDLKVVAIAAALLVIVGLVVLVRGVMRNRDVQTTVFALLVGVLLTVSPAILVWLGR